jgi:maleylacetoacetate isomerase
MQSHTPTEQAKSSGADPEEWLKFFTERGLKAFETVVSRTAGRYCFGDTITLADVCLAPALWNAEKHGVDIESFPTIHRVYAALKDHPSFKKSHWRNQSDCPEELR